MKKRDYLNPVQVIDKNGRKTTVYRKDPNGTSGRLASVKAAVAVPESDPAAITDELMLRLVHPNNLSWDSVRFGFEAIMKWEQPWTAAETKNISTIQDIADVLDRTPFTVEDESTVRDLIAGMEPAVVSQKRTGGWSSKDPNADNWRARDKMLHDLADDLLVRRLGEYLEYEPVDSEADNERLMGLREAQDFTLDHYNHPSYYAKDGKTYMGDVEPFYQDAIARVVRGDEISELLMSGESSQNLFPESERIFASLHPDVDNQTLNNQLYLAAVFPVRELKEEMDKAGIENVSVTPFYNSREWGNAYTVITPTGTRSFSVYEHRNTDSMIINGMNNWDGEGLPYAGESNEFFAEFAPEDKKRLAQALTFYMMQAQQGTLGDDDDLVRTASKLDWNDILDKKIRGFKAWRQSKISDTYIAPADESDDEALSRLDF